MAIGSQLKALVERTTRSRILRESRLLRGIDLHVDLRNHLPGFRPAVVFDVGANVGDTAEAFLAEFPAAAVYAFEPAATTFRRLSRRFQQEPRVQCFRLAVGAEQSHGVLVADGPGSPLASLTRTAQVTKAASAHAEEVEISSLDRFTEGHRVDHIGLLKVDTEGYDLEVLKGAERLLRSDAVDLVEVEAGLNPENRTHVPFGILKPHLEARGYRLFGIYEQAHEWTLAKPHLRRVNCVFASESLLAGHGESHQG